MMFAGSAGVGFVAVLSFVAIFVLLASAIWSNSKKDDKRKNISSEQNEPSANDKMKIILIIAAVLLFCIVLAAFGLK